MFNLIKAIREIIKTSNELDEFEKSILESPEIELGKMLDKEL